MSSDCSICTMNINTNQHLRVKNWVNPCKHFAEMYFTIIVERNIKNQNTKFSLTTNYLPPDEKYKREPSSPFHLLMAKPSTTRTNLENKP